jgi:outer membrane protein OmpA-like peptidoglycan-associated protein
MKNTSAPLVKLGILALPQILLLLMASTAHAELIGNVKHDAKIKHKEPVSDKSKVTSKQSINPSDSAQTTKPPDTKMASEPAKIPEPAVNTIKTTQNPNTAKTPNTPEQTSPRIVILSPTVGTVLDTPAATVVIQMPSNVKIELLANGKVVNPNSIGRSELDETNKTITQTWYGVTLQAGDNQITVRVIGSESAASSVNLKVRGTPTKLVVSTLESRIPADGRSYVTVDGQLVDADGNRSIWDALVTLEASEGEFIGTDASPEQPGFQVKARNGKFSAQLKSGLKTGTVTIRARNAQMEAFTQVQFETDLRPSLVTGVIDLRVGARGTDFYRSLRDFLPADRNNSTQVDLYGAVFGTGRVGEWLFTGAYNNSRTLNQDCAGNSSLAGAEKYCDQQYPVYGDSSTVTRTTPSYDSLFLRFERNSPVQGASTDYFMWGNYGTEEFTSRSQQFSAISRQLQGFKGNFNLGDLQITGFYSNVGKGFQRDTIAPNGTSGTYFLSKRLLINGSENVSIELIDFFSAGTVVSRKELARGKDYDINYDNGSILFRQPLLQTELGDLGQLLRRQIVVTYQNEQVGGDSNLYGGQLRYHLNRSQSQPSWIGANYFKESLGIRNFVLYGANALISFGEKTQLIAEYARSQNDSELLGYVTGSAMRFELNSEIASGLVGKLYYTKAETGFANNATISFVPGQTKYGGDLTAKITPTTSLQFRYDQEDNLGVAPRPLTTLADLLNPRQEAIPGSAVDNSLRTISLGVQQNIGAMLLNLDLLYRDRQDRQSPNVLSSNSTQLRSRLSVPIADNLRVTAQNEVSLSASADAVIPDRSVLSLDWTIVQGLTARLGQQWFHSGPLAGQAITSADLLGEYKLGTDTTFTGRYSVIGGANNAASTQGALGLNQRWQVLPGLRMSFGYEHVFGSFTTATTTGTSFLQPFAVGQSSSALTFQSGDSYNVGVEYTDNPDLKASARFEHRSDNTNSSTVFSASALGKLSPALTMLFNYQQSSAANQLISGLGTISNLKVGLAYRDPEDDKFNVLLRYEYRQNPSIIPDSLLLGGGSGYTDHTLALEAIYAPNWQWEFYGKLALRNSTTTIAQDFTGISNTNLSQFRVTYRLGYNVELVGETRLLNQPTAGYSELGLVGEVGYFLTPNLRLAAGYSSGSVNVDRDFSGSRSTGGLYAGITVKLNELFDGFGLQKTPPRQQQEPEEPVRTVAKTPQPEQKLAAAIPSTPQIISLNVARSLTFKEGAQGKNADLAGADIAILENLAAVLKEYNNLSIDIQGYIGSLADMNSGDNLAANRMMAARKYLLDRGVTSNQMTLRSLGSIATAESPDKVIVAKATPVSFAISGQADVFNAIATRLQAMSPNSPTTEFLQSILPNAATSFQANASPVNNPNNGANPSISVGVNVGNDGKIADLSYATLDRMIERLNSNSSLLFEIQTSSTLSASAGQDLETFKMLAVRSYLLDKGVSSDRILLSSNGANANTANQTGNSQVYISLNTDESNINIAKAPTTTPTAQAITTTPLAADPANDIANRRLATAFNFLLSSNGDTVTAFLRAIGANTEKSGFAIAPDQLSNLKN